MFKQILSFFLGISLMGSLLAASPAIPYGVFVYDESGESLSLARNIKQFVVDHALTSGHELYGIEDEINQYLEKNNFFALPLIRREKTDVSYPSYKEVTDDLKLFEKNYPQIFKLMSIGKSVKGKELWVMKVSDHVAIDEIEPELKLVANMHGDEIVGRELMILFLKDIAKAYSQKDPRILKLVNETELYIMPSMNPDGAEAQRRSNANYVDLNRDFPDFSTSDNQNTWSNRAIETVNMMKFQAQRNFVLSANFHGGSVVVNYPWDTTKNTFPLEDLVIDLSLTYSKNNSEMYNSTEFSHGIVNGFDWYEVDGGMQDWSYYWHQDLQVTIELSNQKWPNYNTISNYYKNNRLSILSYLENVYKGIGVKFSTKNASGVIELYDLDKNLAMGEFSYQQSEFYKVLSAGHYKVKIFDQQKNLMDERDFLIESDESKPFYEQL